MYCSPTFQDALKACTDLNNRWFGGRPIYAELTPVTDFREACCRQYETGECTRSGFCNFMHLKPISRKLRGELYGRNGNRGGGRDDRDRERQPDLKVGFNVIQSRKSTSLTRIYVKLSELEMTFNFWAVRCKVWSLPWSVMLYTLWTLAEATPNNSLPISSLPEYIWKLSTLWSTTPWGPPCSPTWCPP